MYFDWAVTSIDVIEKEGNLEKLKSFDDASKMYRLIF